MKLEIIGIDNEGGLENECVNLKVLEDCNLGNYLIADCTYVDEHAISNKARHTFFFPDWNVKKGHEVLLWTYGDFNPKTVENDGLVIHNFFWRFDTEIWNNEGDCAFLCELSDWKAFNVAPNK